MHKILNNIETPIKKNFCSQKVYNVYRKLAATYLNPLQPDIRSNFFKIKKFCVVGVKKIPFKSVQIP